MNLDQYLDELMNLDVQTARLDFTRYFSKTKNLKMLGRTTFFPLKYSSQLVLQDFGLQSFELPPCCCYKCNLLDVVGEHERLYLVIQTILLIKSKGFSRSRECRKRICRQGNVAGIFAVCKNIFGNQENCRIFVARCIIF